MLGVPSVHVLFYLPKSADVKQCNTSVEFSGEAEWF